MYTIITAVEQYYLNCGKVVVKIGIANHNIAPIMCSYSLN